MSKTVRIYKKAPVRRRAPARAYPVRRYAPRRYVGQGDYKLYKAPRAIRASKATSSSLGGSIGAYLGNGVHQVVKALTGFGDYTVMENSISSGTIGGDPPTIQNTRNNSFIVHHREYIGDVFAASSFTPTTFPINPGMLSTFPWLHQVADSFEQYKFRGLVFEYKSMSSDAVLSVSASSALGTVIMSTQYNVLDEPFSDKRSMENYEYANSSKPSCSFFHPIECKMSQTSVAELYVRSTPVTVGDARLYDLGNFTVAVQGMQNVPTAPSVIGELWVTLEVEFFKPKLLIGGGDLLTDHFHNIGNSIIATGTPFGSGGLSAASNNSVGCTFLPTGTGPYGDGTLLFPASITDGKYLITYYINGAASAISAGYQNGTVVNIDVTSSAVTLLNGNVVNFEESPQAGVAGTTKYMLQVICEITQITPGRQAGLQFVFTGTFPGGTQSIDMIVTQISPKTN